MAIAFVASSGNDRFTGDSSSSLVPASSNAVTTGDAIVVFVLTVDTAGYKTVSGITDTASNTYAICGSRHQVNYGGLYVNVECWVALNITGHAANYVTANYATADYYASITLGSWSGMASSGAYDTGYDPAGNTDSASVYTTTADTTAEDNELVIGYFMTIGGSSQTRSSSSPSVLRYSQASGFRALADNAAATAGSFSVSVASSVNEDNICFAKAFKQAQSIEQEGFRFRNDDGSESAATWKANQDTNITLAADTAFRLRDILNATGDPSSIGAQLEYRYKPSGGAFGSWAKVN